MVAWTGIEHFSVGRFDPPPSVDELEDAVVSTASYFLFAISLISLIKQNLGFWHTWQLDLRPRWPLGEEYSPGRSEARSLRTARIHPSLTSIIQASNRRQCN